MTRRPQLCPTCHRPMPPLLVVSGQIRQRIVDAIAGHPGGIGRRELADLVYADRADGGPGNLSTVSVLVKRANAELAGQGYRITPAWPGHGGKYRLEKVAP